MVVEESAVITELAFSSAVPTAGRLTSPTAAKANVHFSNFIRSSDLFGLLVTFPI